MFFKSQTDNELIIEYGVQYLTIVTIGSPLLYISIISERLMQSTGKTVLSMYTQGLGAITNIILDPILIFVLGWDVVGAAIATILGQLASAVFGVIINQKFNREVRLELKNMKLHGRTVKKIYSVGVPSIIMVGIGSVMNCMLNSMLITFFSTKDAAVLGAYYKIQSFAFMPLFGMNNGLIPIIAYNKVLAKLHLAPKNCICFPVLIAETQQAIE